MIIVTVIIMIMVMIRVIRNNSSGKSQPYMGGTGHVRCRENDEHWNRYRKNRCRHQEMHTTFVRDRQACQMSLLQGFRLVCPCMNPRP